MDKGSEETDGTWKFSAAIPSLTEDGIVEYYIDASNGGLSGTTPVARIAVTEQPAIPNLMAWGIQIVILLEIAGFAAFFIIKVLARNGKIGNPNRRERNG